MKSIIKKILQKLGWKLIKLRKPPEPNPYGKLDEDVLKSINNSFEHINQLINFLQL